MAQIIAGGTKPDSGGNVEVITQTQTTTWAQLQGKPYIAVSSKGIYNGLSTIPNDGADFGPDTTKGATSPGQYGSPYTNAFGTQEAIDYVMTSGGGVVKILPGRYVFPNTQTWTKLSTNFAPGDVADQTLWGMLLIKNLNPNTVVSITIEGSGSITNAENDFTPSEDRGTVFDFSNVTVPQTVFGNGFDGDVNYYAVLANTPTGQTTTSTPGCLLGNTGGISAFMRDIMFILPSPLMSGPMLWWLTSGEMKNVSVSCVTAPTTSLYSNNGSTFLQGIPFSWGAWIDAQIGGVASANNIYVSNADTCLIAGAHTTVGSLYGTGSRVGFLAFSDHVPSAGRLDFESMLFANIMLSPSFLGLGCQGPLIIKMLDGEDYTTTYGDIWDVWYGSGAAASEPYGTPDIIIEAFHMESINQTATFRPPYIPYTNIAGQFPSGSLIPKIRVLKVMTNSTTYPSIPANPPVSGTSYQNTNGSDIRIKIPVTYSPTSSAAATLATGISSTSTVSTSTKVSIPAGVTAGEILTYEMVVPAGWYFELVVTNATIGTVEVQVA